MAFVLPEAQAACAGGDHLFGGLGGADSPEA